ncbi:MAG: hypothetical protein ACFB16_12875 [Phormidesmis sp.]
MFFNSAVLAIAITTNVVSLPTYDCVPCQQKTIYMPDIPAPEMASASHLAVPTDDATLVAAKKQPNYARNKIESLEKV